MITMTHDTIVASAAAATGAMAGHLGHPVHCRAVAGEAGIGVGQHHMLCALGPGQMLRRIVLVAVGGQVMTFGACHEPMGAMGEDGSSQPAIGDVRVSDLL